MELTVNQRSDLSVTNHQQLSRLSSLTPIWKTPLDSAQDLGELHEILLLKIKAVDFHTIVRRISVEKSARTRAKNVQSAIKIAFFESCTDATLVLRIRPSAKNFEGFQVAAVEAAQLNFD